MNKRQDSCSDNEPICSVVKVSNELAFDDGTPGLLYAYMKKMIFTCTLYDNFCVMSHWYLSAMSDIGWTISAFWQQIIKDPLCGVICSYNEMGFLCPTVHILKLKVISHLEVIGRTKLRGGYIWHCGHYDICWRWMKMKMKLALVDQRRKYENSKCRFTFAKPRTQFSLDI